MKRSRSPSPKRSSERKRSRTDTERTTGESDDRGRTRSVRNTTETGRRDESRDVGRGRLSRDRTETRTTPLRSSEASPVLVKTRRMNSPVPVRRPPPPRASSRHMPAPGPGTHRLERLEERRVERASGLISRVDGRNVIGYLHGVTSDRAKDFSSMERDGQLTGQDVGPVTSVAIDRRTGEVFEGTNGQGRDVIPLEHLHPLLVARLNDLRRSGPYPAFDRNFQPIRGGTWEYPHFDHPLRHAEVKAVNELLWRRGRDVRDENIFSDLMIDNRFPFADDTRPGTADAGWHARSEARQPQS